MLQATEGRWGLIKGSTGWSEKQIKDLVLEVIDKIQLFFDNIVELNTCINEQDCHSVVHNEGLTLPIQLDIFHMHLNTSREPDDTEKIYIFTL